MIETLHAVSGRPVIVTLAILGAAMVTAASLLKSREASPGRLSVAGLLHYGGYTLTGASILLFIVAGFISGR